MPFTFVRQVVDDFVRVSDGESFNTARRLAREEGLLVGGSSGTALAAAIKYAPRLPAGSNVVVLFPDTGRNYLTKIFSDDWMFENGFLKRAPEKIRVGEILKSKDRFQPLIYANAEDLAINAANTIRENGISQLPVLKDKRVVGGLNEVTLIKLLYDGVNLAEKRVSEIMCGGLPILDAEVDVAELYRLFMAGNVGVVITRRGEAEGFLSRIDLANFWIKRIKVRKAE